MSPKGPYKLVTVNTAPDRAKRLIGKAVRELEEQYTIEHVANCESKVVSNPNLIYNFANIRAQR